ATGRPSGYSGRNDAATPAPMPWDSHRLRRGRPRLRISGAGAFPVSSGLHGATGESLLDDRQDVAGRKDQQVITAVTDLGAAVLAVDHGVANCDVQRDAVAVVVDPARANSQDLAFLRLLFGGVRDNQT